MPWIVFIGNQEWSNLVSTINRIDANLQTLVNTVGVKMSEMEDALAELTEQAKANTDAEQSAIKLIQDLATLIQQSADDPTKIRTLAAQLKTSADALGAAVVAGTPAAPTT